MKLLKKIGCKFFKCVGPVYNFSLPIERGEGLGVYFGISVCPFCHKEKLAYVSLGSCRSYDMPIVPGDSMNSRAGEILKDRTIRRRTHKVNDLDCWIEAIEGLKDFVKAHPMEALTSPYTSVRELGEIYLARRKTSDDQESEE